MEISLWVNLFKQCLVICGFPQTVTTTRIFVVFRKTVLETELNAPENGSLNQSIYQPRNAKHSDVD